MSAVVHEIAKVEDHPEAGGLSLVHVAGEVVVSAKITDPVTMHRYKAGNLVVYVSEGSIVPEYILRQGFWDDRHDKGGLGGSKGNRVKMRRFAGVESRGILLAVNTVDAPVATADGEPVNAVVASETGEQLGVKVGSDVSDFIGVTDPAPQA